MQRSVTICTRTTASLHRQWREYLNLPSKCHQSPVVGTRGESKFQVPNAQIPILCAEFHRVAGPWIL